MLTLRETLILAAVAVALLFGGSIAWRLHKAALARENGLRVAAEQSAALAKDTTRIIERTMTHENTIYRQAEVEADAIQAIPGADALVPDELLSEWGRSLDGMRPQAATPDDSRP